MMKIPVLKFSNIPRWSIRSACIAGWLIVGFGWALHSQHGVEEIQRAESPRNLPLALARSSPDDVQFPSPAAWEVDAPGIPLSSPSVWGHLAVTPLVDANRRAISLWAVDRRNGRLIWQTPLHRQLTLSEKSRNSAATPACDGQSFFLAAAIRGRLQVSAVDFQGRRRWTADLGPVSSEDGRLFSPLLYDSLVIAAGDQSGSRWDRDADHLTAVHRLTGEIIWRVRRPDVEGGGTPVLANVAGRQQILIPSAGRIAAYDPAQGQLLWTCRGEAGRAAPSVAWNDRLVFAASGAPSSVVTAIRADGKGDVSATHIAWQGTAPSAANIAPMIFQNSVLCLSDNGQLTSLDVETGKSQWRKQLSGLFSLPPILEDDQLLCINAEGAAYQVDLTSRGQTVREQSLASGITAPAAATHRQLIFPRTSGLKSIPWDREEIPVVNTPEAAPNRL